MIRTTARFLIKLLETLKIEVINNSIHDADRVGRSYQLCFHQFFVEKERFGWECKDENVTLP